MKLNGRIVNVHGLFNRHVVVQVETGSLYTLKSYKLNLGDLVELELDEHGRATARKVEGES